MTGAMLSIHAQTDSTATAKVSLVEDTCVQVAPLHPIVIPRLQQQAFSPAAAEVMTAEDSLNAEKQAKRQELIKNVAVPAAVAVGSIIGAPIAGAVSVVKAASKTGKVYEKYVPEEIKSNISEQVKDFKGQKKEVVAEAKGQTNKPQLLSEIGTFNLGDFQIPAGNYSGITWLGADSFAIVDDCCKGPGFYIIHLNIDPKSGKIKGASRNAFSGNQPKEKSDCEDIVFIPQCQTFFIADEGNQTIREYDKQGRYNNHELVIPEQFSAKSIQSNAGFESLAFDADSARFWSLTEKMLTTDSLIGKAGQQPLRLQQYEGDLQPTLQWAYLMEAPVLKQDVPTYLHGVSAILSLGGNRLLVMERELSVPESHIGAKTNIRLFQVDLDETAPIEGSTNLKQLSAEGFLHKTEVFNFTTMLNIAKMNFANYEGMCLGPILQDGKNTLLLISDSQNGMGNSLYHLKDYIKVLAF